MPVNMSYCRFENTLAALRESNELLTERRENEMPALSEVTNRVVESYHCMAEEADENGLVGIYNEDGEFLLAVPADMPPDILRIALQYGARRYTDGRKRGNEEVRVSIRNALGI